MSEERDPVRLREDPAADASLREALGAAAGERADDAMLERVLAGVLASGAGGGGTSGGGGGGASTATKIAIGLGGTTMTAVLVALVVHGASIPASPSAVPSIVARDASSAPDAAPALVDAWVPTDAGTDASVPTQAAIRRPAPTSAPPPATPVESDEQLLFRAIRARDPEAGLALLRQHRALHPDSASAEDREAQIAIDLARLGRADEARAAAAAFRTRWPSSPALPHVEAELERMPSSE